MSAQSSQSLSPLRAAWQRLMRQRMNAWALWFLVALVLLCAIGPKLSPYDQSQQDLELKATNPSTTHWLGTDPLGRDMLTRILHGGRVSLEVGLLATAVAAIIGVCYGMASGLVGGRIDAALMRIVDILYAFPFINFVILLMAIVGREFWLIFVAIGAVEWLTMARVVRGQVLALKNLEFITAARASGASFWHIVWRHLLPNVMGPVIIYASLTVPGVMLLEAALSFLGLGIQPPTPSLGQMLGHSQEMVWKAWWMPCIPGVAITLLVLAFNLMGDRLRDVLDPRLRGLGHL
jgi:oligopeptide transport system permease protein